MTKSCAKCVYYVKERCHRYPPVTVMYANANKETQFCSEWAFVHPYDWCGEFKKAESEEPK